MSLDMGRFFFLIKNTDEFPIKEKCFLPTIRINGTVIENFLTENAATEGYGPFILLKKQFYFRRTTAILSV